MYCFDHQLKLTTDAVKVVIQNRVKEDFNVGWSETRE